MVCRYCGVEIHPAYGCWFHITDDSAYCKDSDGYHLADPYVQLSHPDPDLAQILEEGS